MRIFLSALLLSGCASIRVEPAPPTVVFRVDGLDTPEEQDALIHALRTLRGLREFGVSLDGGIVDVRIAPGGRLRLSDLRICVARAGGDLSIAEGEIVLHGRVRILRDGAWSDWSQARIPYDARNVEWSLPPPLGPPLGPVSPQD